jgi:class 3 adenylate cyclase
MEVLAELHAALGDLIFRFEGTLERFAGDGLMVFFNDPVRCDDGPARAIRMSVAMRTRVRSLAEGWARQGHDLALGIGIAQGYATLGRNRLRRQARLRGYRKRHESGLSVVRGRGPMADPRHRASVRGGRPSGRR